MSESGESIEEEQPEIPPLGVYEGERNEAKQRHGKGKNLYPNGDTYVGEYSQGKRHGQGIYTFKNGGRYEGAYENNKKHGVGTFQYVDGGVYQGEWDEDKRHGQGTYRYPNGDVYEGDWRNGEKQGHGKYTYKEHATQYVGDFQSGKISGQGEWILTDGTKLKAKFVENEPVGNASFHFPHGAVQTGSYVRSKGEQGGLIWSGQGYHQVQQEAS